MFVSTRAKKISYVTDSISNTKILSGCNDARANHIAVNAVVDRDGEKKLTIGKEASRRLRSNDLSIVRRIDGKHVAYRYRMNKNRETAMTCLALALMACTYFLLLVPATTFAVVWVMVIVFEMPMPTDFEWKCWYVLSAVVYSPMTLVCVAQPVR